MNTLVIFTRYPTPGTTKTRLIPALGAEGAATLHRWMVERMVQEGRLLRDRFGVEVYVCFSGGTVQEMQLWLGDDLSYEAQQMGNLGDRLCGVLRDRFQVQSSLSCQSSTSSQSVVMIGTDCPGISADLLERSFQHLKSVELVIGPALDGGYYLIGVNDYYPQLFEGITWSSDRVFQETIDRAEGQNLTWVALEPLPDIDRPEDLTYLPSDFPSVLQPQPPCEPQTPVPHPGGNDRPNSAVVGLDLPRLGAINRGEWPILPKPVKHPGAGLVFAEPKSASTENTGPYLQ